MLRSILVALGTLVATAGSAQAGRGGVLPPMELEVGQTTLHGATGPRILATQLQVGLSWAALVPTAPVDVTIGWIGVLAPRVAAPDPSLPAGRATAAPPADATGGYLDVAVAVGAGRHWRTWLGGRGEVLASGSEVLTGAAARVQTELWAPVATTAPRSFMVGSFGLSMWAELGVRGQVGAHAGATAAAGLGLRLPLVVAL